MSLKCIWGHCKRSVSQTRAAPLIIIIITRTLMVCRVTVRRGEWQGTQYIWVAVGFDCGRGGMWGNQWKWKGCFVAPGAKPQLARLQESGLEARGWGKGSHWRQSCNTRGGRTLLKHHCRHRDTNKLETAEAAKRVVHFEAALWSLNCVLCGLASEFFWHKLQSQKRREHNPSWLQNQKKRENKPNWKQNQKKKKKKHILFFAFGTPLFSARW